MRDGAEVTLRGAEAIAGLRREMTDAEGTAASFRERLLDTFEGQKTLLQGTLQTFAVVLGEPFAAVFKPIVRVIVNVLNAILRAFQAIPAPIKKIFATFVQCDAVAGECCLRGRMPCSPTRPFARGLGKRSDPSTGTTRASRPPGSMTDFQSVAKFGEISRWPAHR